MADEVTKLAIESKFRAVQEAYDILSDPARRREYDSVDDFDDSLPVDCAPADFFKVRMTGCVLHNFWLTWIVKLFDGAEINCLRVCSD